ncbi:ABC transporter G family member 23-like [Watersipora subatra]|uniref:ABC transporter G family member 23-like n=1 Tax=Watersipora subatra TaxID=2589382 RepID=UPI00355B2F77
MEESDSTLLAVNVCDVYKSYTKKVPVLQGTTLMVRKGNIYGLLGPSGCGKTSLLKLIVGRLKPDKGSVRVLGYKPGSLESNIPGSRVGYMPQELALYQEFTISETMHFFGRIHKMSAKQITERMKFLLDFLELPPPKRMIHQLSGGQQRRVSLAIALLHSPEILILDEPTVGVDPLLRQRIWDHLVGISSTGGISIIITTHYIEEARSANSVGLMRSGRILAEGPPDKLMQKFQQTSLENVFLDLCVKDDQTLNGYGAQSAGSSSQDVDVVVVDDNPDDDEDVRLLGSGSYKYQAEQSVSNGSCSHACKSFCSSFPKATNVAALLIKNINQLKRKIGFLLFQFLLPAIQIALFAFCVGGTPHHLPVDVVNMDTGLSSYGVDLSFSKAYLEGLDKDVVDIHYTSSLEDAKQHVVDGHSWAVLLFQSNFTLDTIIRVMNSSNNSTDVLKESTINVWMDETNSQITLPLQGQFIKAYQQMGPNVENQAKKIYNITHLPFDIDSVQLPITYDKPIYGKTDENFLDFVAPGIMCSIIFFLAVGLTSLTLVLERKEGLFERSLVSGVSVTEMMLGHIGTQFIVMCIQTAVLLIFSLIVFKVYNVGSIIVIIIFELLIGFSGMCLGFVISTGATDESSALQLSLAIVFPFLLISGILWPIESMPQWLQYIAIWLPLTLPVKGLRSVLGRGWGFEHYDVWSGYCVGVGWTIGFLILSLIVSHIRKLN